MSVNTLLLGYQPQLRRVSDSTLLLVLDVFYQILRRRPRSYRRRPRSLRRYVVASLRRYVERNQELLISYLSYRKMSYRLSESSRLEKQSTGVFDRG